MMKRIGIWALIAFPFGLASGPFAHASDWYCKILLKADLEGSYGLGQPIALPERLLVPLDEAEVSELFHLAHANWLEGSDFPKLEAILQKAAEKGIKGLSESQILKLKDWRRKASELRSAWALFDRDHAIPSGFGDFVRDFGRLNDAVANDVNKMGKNYAKKLLEGDSFKDLATRIRKFKPAEPATVLGKLVQNLKEVQRLMEAPTVTVEEFHEVRKLMKDAMNFYKLRGANRLTPEIYAAADWLHRLNLKLGELHDGWLAAALQEQVDHEKQRVAFPPEIARDIRKFVARALEQPL